MRALVIQHDEDAPAALVDEWLAERGAERELYLVARDDSGRDPVAYDLVVVLGSAQAAYDDSVPWVGRELALLRDAVRAEVPVLGICFGGQLLARALGGEAMRAAQPELGWVEIRTDDPALVSEGPWMQWHYDTFRVPPGAKLVAHSPAGPQAYTIGRSLGIQFHPEVTAELVEMWVLEGGDQLRRMGLDPDRLLAESRERDAENRTRAWRLLDAFTHRVARIARVPFSGSRIR